MATASENVKMFVIYVLITCRRAR